MVLFQFSPDSGLVADVVRGLFVVVDDVVCEVHHGLCHLEQVGHLLQPVGPSEKVVAHPSPAAIVLHLQVADVLIVGWEVSRCLFEVGYAEALVGRIVVFVVPIPLVGLAEGVDEGLVLHTHSPRVDVAHDFVAHGGEDVGGEPVGAHSQQAMVGLYVEVVTAVEPFLAVGGDIGAEVALVGALVFGEAYVAVEAVAAVLERQVGYGVVEGCDALDGFGDALLKGLLGLQVFGLVFVKPVSVVVGRYLTEKAEYESGVHIIIIRCKRVKQKKALRAAGRKAASEFASFQQLGAKIMELTMVAEWLGALADVASV